MILGIHRYGGYYLRTEEIEKEEESEKEREDGETEERREERNAGYLNNGATLSRETE